MEYALCFNAKCAGSELEGKIMCSGRTAIAMLSTALSLLIGLPVLADGLYIIDPAGNIIDGSSGTIVRKTTVVAPKVVPTATVSAPLATVIDAQSPMPVPAPGTTVTRKIVVTKTTVPSSGWIETPATSYTVTKSACLADVLTDVLDLRRAELARQINLISDVPTNMSLRAQLLEVAAREAALRQDDALTYGDAIALAQQLDQLNTQVYTIRQSDRLTPLVLTNVGGVRQIAVTDMPM
jgi:hypothetical protein